MGAAIGSGDRQGQFVLGVNYWPIDRAMYWWQDPDVRKAERDFGRLAEYGLFLVRIFLLWEEFQPEPGSVSLPALTTYSARARVTPRICKPAGKAACWISPQ